MGRAAWLQWSGFVPGDFHRRPQMGHTSSERVRHLLRELCREHGLCYACRHPEKFEDLVGSGPAEFTEQVFLAEGLEPVKHIPLLLEVRAHVSFAFDTWKGEGDAV